LSEIPTASGSARRSTRLRCGFPHWPLAKAFLAIDRVSKFTYVELHPAATMLTGAAFLRGVVAAFPYKLHTVLTDNGVPFTDRPDKRSGPTAQYRLHVFDRICRENAIVHKLTKPYHPWTNARPSG
jgi:hypothetical protein